MRISDGSSDVCSSDLEELGGLGTRLSSGGGGETSVVSFSALKPTLLPSLRIFADVVLHPAFAPKDFDRLKEQILAGIPAATQRSEECRVGKECVRQCRSRWSPLH